MSEGKQSANQSLSNCVTSKLSKRAPKARQIRSGRWMKSQHETFIRLLQQNGCNWKSFVPYLQTRNLEQIRSHAQKHFRRLSRTEIDAYRQKGVENILLSMKMKNHDSGQTQIFNVDFDDQIHYNQKATTASPLTCLSSSITVISDQSVPFYSENITHQALQGKRANICDINQINASIKSDDCVLAKETDFKACQNIARNRVIIPKVNLSPQYFSSGEINVFQPWFVPKQSTMPAYPIIHDRDGMLFSYNPSKIEWNN